MTWLTPLTGLLAFAAVVPPLVVLYFLRLRRKRREISSTLLWRRSVEDLEANAPWQRLRPNLLLLLQLLVLLALAAAVAQPLAQGGSRS
ncbi:MAG: BatA domain-containing protein, partial [Phycisphaerales bacterium]